MKTLDLFFHITILSASLFLGAYCLFAEQVHPRVIQWAIGCGLILISQNWAITQRLKDKLLE